MAWQAGQEDNSSLGAYDANWHRLDAMPRLIHPMAIDNQGPSLLACMLNVLLSATGITSGQGLDKIIVAMTNNIFSGRGLESAAQ
jgi:hypothetical protein